MSPGHCTGTRGREETVRGACPRGPGRPWGDFRPFNRLRCPRPDRERPAAPAASRPRRDWAPNPPPRRGHSSSLLFLFLNWSSETCSSTSPSHSGSIFIGCPEKVAHVLLSRARPPTRRLRQKAPTKRTKLRRGEAARPRPAFGRPLARRPPPALTGVKPARTAAGRPPRAGALPPPAEDSGAAARVQRKRPTRGGLRSRRVKTPRSAPRPALRGRRAGPTRRRDARPEGLRGDGSRATRPPPPPPGPEPGPRAGPPTGAAAAACSRRRARGRRPRRPLGAGPSARALRKTPARAPPPTRGRGRAPAASG